MRRADQRALEVVGPAVQRADDVVAGVAAAAQHHRLAVPADVRDQLDAAVGRAHQRAAFVFLRQRVVVAGLGDRELVADVARAAPEQALHLALEQRGIEIAANRELRTASLELTRGDAQIGHRSSFSKSGFEPCRLRRVPSAGLRDGPRIVAAGSATEG